MIVTEAEEERMITRGERIKLPISAVILSYNEEANIEDCIRSLVDWVETIFIVDSYSTDKTLDIARNYEANIYQNEFENYSMQRNWALQNLPIETEWILNLDSDHRVSNELRNELFELFSNRIDENINGFLISRKIIFMGRWIKHGTSYPVYQANLFRKGYGLCENRLYDQHFIIKGKVEYLNGSMMDVNADSVANFTEKHNRWATLEAIEILSDQLTNNANRIQPNPLGHAIEQRRFLKISYYRLPLLVRPFLYFVYRYFFRLGFLDGKEGLIFHFLQGLWFRFLVDSKMYEIKRKAITQNRELEEVVVELYRIAIERKSS